MAATEGGGPCTPPPVETCEGLQVIDQSELPYDVTEPLGCFNDIVDKPYFDVFYRFDCQCTGQYTLDMCDSAGDTYLRIYTGACGWSGGSEFAVADDSCPGSPPNADPLLTVTLQTGISYWFELGTWRPDPPWAPPPNSPYNFRFSADSIDPPNITEQPQSQSLCEGGTIALSVATETPSSEFQWRKDGIEIPGATAASLLIPSASPDDAGDYDVVVASNCGSIISDAAVIDIANANDFDADGDVDLADFGNFQLCFTGPGGSASPDCTCADSDQDGDVDLSDFGQFQLDFTGAGG